MQDARPWQFTTPQGFTLRGQILESPGQPVVFFLHGNGFCGGVYEPLLQALRPRLQVVTLDLQGHGASDAGPRFLGWNANAHLAAQAWQSLAPQFQGLPHHLMGHSFGGVLSGLILAQHPGAFQQAVLLDPVIFPPGMIAAMHLMEPLGLLKHHQLARGARNRRAQWASAEEATAYLRGRGTFKGWDEAALAAYVRHALKRHDDGSVHLRCHPGTESAVFASFPKGLWKQLARIHAPVHILHGDRTMPFVKPSALRWAARAPQVRVTEVPGGHCFMQQQPAQTALAVAGRLLGSTPC